MGRKRSGQGKHFYFCVACLILFSISGCATLREDTERQQARDSILLAQRLLAQGDYEGSLRENQKVASRFARRPPGDEAIFDMALIYADTGNPKKDYRRAIGLFQKLLGDYPESALRAQAKIWIGVLEAHERLAQANEKLTQTNEKLMGVIKKSQQVDLEIELMKREKEKRGQ